MGTLTVYIELLEEGITVWRPVEAEAGSADIVRLPATAPDGEVWRFAPGSLVHYEEQRLSHGPALVATERVSDG